MSAHVLLISLNKFGKRDKNARLVERFISFWQRVKRQNVTILPLFRNVKINVITVNVLKFRTL